MSNYFDKELYLADAIRRHPDAYPYVLEMLNVVLKAGLESNSIGGSEPDMLRGIGQAIKMTLATADPVSATIITVV